MSEACEFQAVISRVATTRKVEKKREGVRLVLTVTLKTEDLEAEHVEELGDLQRSGDAVICTLSEDGEKGLVLSGIVERQITQRDVDSEEAGPRLVTSIRLVSDAVETAVLGPMAQLQKVTFVGVRLEKVQMDLPGTK